MNDIETTEATTSPLAQACEAGKVRLFRLRGNGTRRAIPYLTGDAREVAEWYEAKISEGNSLALVAATAQVSRPTVRRALAALALTEAIEAGDHDDCWDAEEPPAELEFGGDDADE